MNYVEIGRNKIQYLMNNQYLHSYSKNYVGTSGIEYSDTQVGRLNRATNSTLTSLKNVISRQKKNENAALRDIGVTSISELNKIFKENALKNEKILEEQELAFNAKEKITKLMDKVFTELFSEDIDYLQDTLNNSKIKEKLSSGLKDIFKEIEIEQKSTQKNDYLNTIYKKILKYFSNLLDKNDFESNYKKKYQEMGIRSSSKESKNLDRYTVRDIQISLIKSPSGLLNQRIGNLINKNVMSTMKSIFGENSIKVVDNLEPNEFDVDLNSEVEINIIVDVNENQNIGIKLKKVKNQSPSISFGSRGNIHEIVDIMKKYKNTAKIADILNSKTFLYTFGNQFLFGKFSKGKQGSIQIDQEFINSINNALAAVGYIWIGNQFVLKDVNNIDIDIGDYFGKQITPNNILFIFINNEFYPVSKILQNLYDGILNGQSGISTSYSGSGSNSYLMIKNEAIRELRKEHIISGYPKNLVSAGYEASESFIKGVNISISGRKNLVTK